MRKNIFVSLLVFVLNLHIAAADENLLGYVKGAETLPQGSWELYEIGTFRNDKGAGKYEAFDSKTEVEYGFTDRLSFSGSVRAMQVDVEGIVIDGYVPKDNKLSLRPSGVEAGVKYNFLSPAKDDIGFSTYLSLAHGWIDRHSGQDKDTYTMELIFILQKYFLEGEVVWNSNLGIESTYAHRKRVAGKPDDVEWNEFPEVEIGFLTSTGVAYRFRPNWFVGGETIFESEYETEVGTERWSLFAGPSVHYAQQDWWLTLTYIRQLQGGGELFDAQDDKNLHLIEKTKQEARLKIGFNF